MGVRIIAPERPGYGLSSPRRGRLIDYPDDVLQLADALGLERFAAVGVSGGGPAALAAAYRLPQRLTAVGLVSAIGPLYLKDVSRDMVTPNRIILGIMGRRAPALAGSALRLMLRLSMPAMLKHVENGTSPSHDLTPDTYALVALDQNEAVRRGGQGVAYDLRNLWQPWGFDLAAITAPVHVWHGEANNLMPVTLARYVTEHLPNCRATFYPGEGHIEPLLRRPQEVLHALVDEDVKQSIS